jgi:hypothetical protein
VQVGVIVRVGVTGKAGRAGRDVHVQVVVVVVVVGAAVVVAAGHHAAAAVARPAGNEIKKPRDDTRGFCHRFRRFVRAYSRQA